MKKDRRRRFSMRLYMTLLVLVELGVIVAVSGLVSWLVARFDIPYIKLPPLVWYPVVSIVLGAAFTSFISRWVFKPIFALSQAMGQVAKGDFDVRLNEEHLFGDIEDIYHNFNLMTQELGNTETIQTDFVVNVSHEFKTPINAIEGYATLLQAEEDSSPQDRRRYVEKILYNTQRLSKLVSNILLLSKVDHQAISAQGSLYRLDEQIRQSIVQLEPEWEKKDIDLDVELEDLAYTGNESLMLHVWDNLIGNAIKFSPPGGLVGISLKREGEQAVFRVEDCGPGIDAASLGHIFEKFYQSDSSHKQEGNGLGLALVKQILELCGGTVSAENLPEGGCRFTVKLNIAQ